MGRIEEIYKKLESNKKASEELQKRLVENETIKICDRLKSTIKEVKFKIVEKLESNPVVIDHKYEFIRYNGEDCLTFIIIEHHSALYWEDIAGYTYLTPNGQLLRHILGFATVNSVSTVSRKLTFSN